MNPVFPDRDKKSQEEIGEIALSAFHEIADAEMGKEWVDSTKIGSTLLNDEINPDTGKNYGKHVWWVNFKLHVVSVRVYVFGCGGGVFVGCW